MAFYELDEVFGYQDANNMKKLWADSSAPDNPGDGEVWLDISESPFQLKRYNGSTWDIIGETTPVDILTQLKTVDGSGSGLDADLLDGEDGSFYQDASNLNAGTIPQERLSASDLLTLLKTVDGSGSGLDADTLDGAEGSYFRNASNLNAGTVSQERLSASDLLTLLKTVDGSGSGLDADTLDGLDSSSFIRSDSDYTFSGTLTSTKASGAAIKFDNGDSMITVHDGYGNFNIKSGVDETHAIIGSSGGSHLEFSENGKITAAVSDNLVGETFTDDTYVEIDTAGVDVEASQFRVLQGGVEKLKVGTDGKIYEGTTKLEDKYIMREDFIFDKNVTTGFLPRATDTPLTVLNVSGRGAAQVSFGNGNADDNPFKYIYLLTVWVDGVMVCNAPQALGIVLNYHFNTSFRVDAQQSGLYAKCSVSYCNN